MVEESLGSVRIKKCHCRVIKERMTPVLSDRERVPTRCCISMWKVATIKRASDENVGTYDGEPKGLHTRSMIYQLVKASMKLEEHYVLPVST